METRPPHAGIWGFYPLDKDLLIKTLKRCFEDDTYGPGKLPAGHKENTLYGGIAPHAGYSYSGPCAAWLYLALSEQHIEFDTVVIIGTNHTGIGGELTTTKMFDKWSTPLGEIEVDIQFVERLINNGIIDDYRAHEQEHSIEVQLPFLQYTLGNNWRLVPLVAKPMIPSKAVEYARLILEISTLLDRKLLFIVSSDFTHHGFNYGYVIFSTDMIENVRKLDLAFIEKILANDLEGFYTIIERYNATVCGWPAIMILMAYNKELKGKMRLLKYYNSGELTGDESVIVGYASIAAGIL